jgi:hypothetical protein
MMWKPHTEQPEVRVTALFAQQAADGGWALCEGIREWLPESRRWVYELTGLDVEEAEFMWLDERGLLAPLGRVTEV